MQAMKALMCAVVIGVGVNATAVAATMRCAQGVVSQGDTRSEVRRDCGAPSLTERVSGPAVVRLLGSTRFAKRKVELWRYNFGPRSLMRDVYFVDGKVQIIQTGSYGFREVD